MSLKSQMPYGISLLKHYGFHDFMLRFMEWFDTKKRDSYYQKHLDLFFPSEAELDIQRKTSFSYEPLISIVVPAYETPANFLKQLVDNVLSQTYSKLELCIADGSKTSLVYDTLNEYSDSRIKYIKLSKNAGISENTNEGFEHTTGDYIALLDHDDLLTPNALFEMVQALNSYESIPDMVYSDEDKIIADTNVLSNPTFKSDLNEEFLRHTNYICHFLIFSKKLLNKVGGLDSSYDGAQDFEFVLRCNASGAVIKHVPKILYHWRIHPASTAANPESKLYAFENGSKAIEKYLAEKNETGTASLTKDLGFYQIDYALQGDYNVTVLAYTEEQIREMKKMQAERQNLHITYKLIDRLTNDLLLSLTDDYIVISQPDIIPTTPNWIEEFLKHCQWSRIGIVGVKTLNRHNRIENCGFTYNQNGQIFSLFYNLPSIYRGYCHRADSPQNVCGVSFSLSMVRRDALHAANGINETFTFPYQDLDFCFKLSALDYEIILNTDIHALCRKTFLYPAKADEIFLNSWKLKLEKPNPYYNSNLAAKNGNFVLK